MTDPILPDPEPGTADTTLDGPPPSLAPLSIHTTRKIGMGARHK